MLRLLLYKTQTVKSYKRYKNFFSKRVCLISGKQSAAKHKSYDLCCYCLLKGYEFSEVEQDMLNIDYLNLKG